MDWLNIYFRIFIVSLLNLGNTIYATDLGVYNRLGKDIFYFNEKGKEYSFMVLDFSVNGKEYKLSDNKILSDFILKNIPEEKIKTIKEEIIDASKLGKDEDLEKKNYKKLIGRVKIVKLYKTNDAYCYRWRIKHKGSYYKDNDNFSRGQKDVIYIDHYGNPEWKEDSHSSFTVYVINNLIINNQNIDKELEIRAAVTEEDCKMIVNNLYSWCEDCDFKSFGTLDENMDFEKSTHYDEGMLYVLTDDTEIKQKMRDDLKIRNNFDRDIDLSCVKIIDSDNKQEIIFDLLVKLLFSHQIMDFNKIVNFAEPKEFWYKIFSSESPWDEFLYIATESITKLHNRTSNLAKNKKLCQEL